MMIMIVIINVDYNDNNVDDSDDDNDDMMDDNYIVTELNSF
jgi:hypothetical protein